ncbi:DUF1499 domain-containing protein [Shimia sp.]|uniref:DUF1499 domain-containing protein n=1 Tax=Shimia sp. TaxID=1954381 RepID=UPI00329743E5
MVVVWLLIGVFLSAFAYIRLAPSDLTRWHQVPEITADKGFANGLTRVVVIGKDGLRRFADVVEDDPRSHVLAGSVQEGMITFITRSRTIGFPDYTTAIQDGEELKILARSRFGRKDFGVNAERVDRWIAALTAF